MDNKVVALYIRLSVEDSKTDSLSIDGQRKILREYLKKLPEYEYAEVLEFVDNGFTGTTFERPAMTELIDRVNKNQIACILVKDFSRFGRNMLQTGYFLEKVFPLFETRFIAVSDVYDSKDYQYGNGGLTVTFKYLISEYYSKDLSVKSKSARHAKMKRGEYVSTNTFYGYKLNKDRQLVIDEEVADNVQLMFQLALEGKTSTEIKTELYQRNIVTPAEYKSQKGKEYYDVSRTNHIWTSSSILRILYDERYTGTYIMGRSEVKQVGGSRVRKREESQWYKIQNAHPAIIDKQVFDKVQEQLVRFKCTKESQSEYPLKGKIFCGSCHHAMQRLAKKKPQFHCRYTDAISEFPCYNLTISEAEVSEIVFQVLSKQSEVIFALNHLTDATQFEFALKQQDLYSSQISELKNQKIRLYEKLLDKLITLDEYKQEKDAIDGKLVIASNSFNSTSQKNEYLKRTKEEKEKRLMIAQKIVTQKSLSKELVDLLIDRVYVYPNNQLEIVWKIKDFIS
ncbi:recombinase family protein [Anaerotignum sp.]|uniref:recombinase family protein n=1 Tax=Anaerotignum sp. TaxID=2039241 RepID=UPI0028ADF8DB|nr:recombinase family protein [Anaerotignum sp.]